MSRCLPPPRLLLCLTLGLLSSLAVAWLLAALVPIPMYPRTTLGSFLSWGRPFGTAAIRRPGVVDLWWDDMQHDEPDAKPADIIAKQQTETGSLIATRPGSSLDNAAPRWGTFAATVATPATIGSDSAFGWPLPCLWYQVLGETHKGPKSIILDHETLHGGLLLRGEPSARGRDFHALPLRPIWPNLLADTALFALLWFLLLFLPSTLRRAHRRRRNLCPRCGYNPAGLPPNSPCPECGAAPSAPRAPSPSSPRGGGGGGSASPSPTTAP